MFGCFCPYKLYVNNKMSDINLTDDVIVNDEYVELQPRRALLSLSYVPLLKVKTHVIKEDHNNLCRQFSRLRSLSFLDSSNRGAVNKGISTCVTTIVHPKSTLTKIRRYLKDNSF